jgi:undecaprenyl-diphosphatase
MMTFLQSAVLGAAQGIFEWLPVSSEGMIVLLNNNLFNQVDFSGSIELALFLHLGTLCAAVLYFWKDISRIVRNIFSYKAVELKDKQEINFYVWVTIMSAVIGIAVLQLLDIFESVFLGSGLAINIFIACMLFVTAYLLSIQKNTNIKTLGQSRWKDVLMIGIFQGITPIPGISRSGTTVSVMLLQKFSAQAALHGSFILSIPIVIAANAGLLVQGFDVTVFHLVGFLTSFIFGYATINILLKLARRMNFARFVFIFALLVLLSSFL